MALGVIIFFLTSSSHTPKIVSETTLSRRLQGVT